MRSSFSSDEIEEYRTTGFLAVADLLSTDELDLWREVVDNAVEAAHYEASGKNSERAFTQRMHLRRSNAPLARLVDDPRIGGLVAELEGIDSVRLYLDQALVKEPYGAPTQFHLDIPWWGFDSHHACTIWVALDDSTVENGCLYFAPESHQLRLDKTVDLGPDLGAILKATPEITHPPIPRPLPAGGCTFHNGHTVHGAGANMTAGRRRAMTIAFMPGRATYNGRRDVGVLGEPYLDTLSVGDPLDNDDLNPLTWRR